MRKPDKFWDLTAKWYDKRMHGSEAYDRALEHFAEYLNVDDVVLDYACGPGVISFKLADLVKQVDAIDTSGKMIDLAKQRAREIEVENVQFARSSIFDEALKRASYDVVVAFNILHLVEDAQEILKKASELLKPGGLLVSDTPCSGESGGALKTLLPVARRILRLSYMTLFRFTDVDDLTRDGGFEILDSTISGTSYLVVARLGRLG